MLTINEVLAFLNLAVFCVFFTYATRVYIFVLMMSLRRRRRRARAKEEGEAFVSILIPTYNEANVIDRILRACVNLDYENYEVVVVDDSTDGTIRRLKKWARHPKVKVVHRSNRRGWKGGALNDGLRHIDPRSKYVLVFDADFVPPPDVIRRMLKAFDDETVAAVQGAQWHILNADEGWVTRGIRVLLSAFYFFEHPARSVCGGFTQLNGSVMMIRRDVLEAVGGFGESITEDWELTLKLYEHGYRVVYEASVRVPCECPSTLNQAIKQQCRWAEGHTRNFKRYFWRVIRREDLPMSTKLDFIIVGTSYLQAVLSLVSFSLLIVDLLLGVKWPLPDPLAYFLFFYVNIAYPLSMLYGLRLEGAWHEKKDVLYALLLGYILSPFLAYASLRGLFLSRGYFTRTYKTGRVTRPVAPWKGGYYHSP